MSGEMGLLSIPLRLLWGTSRRSSLCRYPRTQYHHNRLLCLDEVQSLSSTLSASPPSDSPSLQRGRHHRVYRHSHQRSSHHVADAGKASRLLPIAVRRDSIALRNDKNNTMTITKGTPLSPPPVPVIVPQSVAFPVAPGRDRPSALIRECNCDPEGQTPTMTNIQTIRATVAIMATTRRRRDTCSESGTTSPAPKPQQESQQESQTAATRRQKKQSRNKGPIAEYWRLSKGRLTMWVSLSTLPAYLPLANPVDPIVLTALLSGTFAASSSAAALNQLVERRYDRQTVRTANRPVASGRIPVRSGYLFAMSMGAVSGALLWGGCNALTAGMAAFNVLGYVLIYTPMKLKSPRNTHVGSLVGSVPILMGASAATGALLASGPLPLTLFTLQSLWQFPHFYLLAWIHQKDYLRAGYRMYPLGDVNGRLTANLIKPFVYATCALPLLSSLMEWTSWMFFVDGSIGNIILYSKFRGFYRDPTTVTANALFFVSLWHLLVIMGLCAFHFTPNLHQKAYYGFFPSEASSSVNAIQRVRDMLTPLCPHDGLMGMMGMETFCPATYNSKAIGPKTQRTSETRRQNKEWESETTKTK